MNLERIRLAEEKDLEACVDLGVAMIKEGYYKDFNINLDAMWHHARRALEGSDWLFLVCEGQYEIEGFFLAQISKTYFGDDLIAEQNLLFIDERYRGGVKTPMNFMRQFRAWAASHNCKRIFFAPTVSIHEGFNVISKRLGYDYVGPMYGRAP